MIQDLLRLGFTGNDLAREVFEILKDRYGKEAHTQGMAKSELYAQQMKGNESAARNREEEAASLKNADKDYAKRKEDEFWAVVKIMAKGTELGTTAYAPSFSLIYTGIYATSGDYKQARQAAIEGVTGYVGGKVIGGVGKLLGNVFGKAVRSLIGKIPFLGSDLSKAAFAFRKAHNISSARNIAVFEYEAADGTLKTLIRASEKNVGHAERLLAKDLAELGVKPNKVTRIYSDLEPCNLPGGYCANFIEKTYTRAKVTYSFDYGPNQQLRKRSVAAMKEAIEEALNR